MNDILITERTTYLITEELKPCLMCKTPTNLVDVYSEARMCSDECVKALDKSVARMEKIFRMEGDEIPSKPKECCDCGIELEGVGNRHIYGEKYYCMECLVDQLDKDGVIICY